LYKAAYDAICKSYSLGFELVHSLPSILETTVAHFAPL